MDFPRFFIVDFPLKFLENIVIVDFPFSFYSGFSFIVDFHGTRYPLIFLEYRNKYIMYAYYKFYSLSMKKFTLQKSIVMKFGEVIVVPKA